VTYLMDDHGPTPKREKKGSPKHEDWIATLDCFRCLKPSQSMRCHIRHGFYTMARKPDASLVVPLCGECHQNSPLAQHVRGNELAWWIENGFPNIKAGARYLFEHSGDIDAYAVARQIARREA